MLIRRKAAKMSGKLCRPHSAMFHLGLHCLFRPLSVASDIGLQSGSIVWRLIWVFTVCQAVICASDIGLYCLLSLFGSKLMLHVVLDFNIREKKNNRM